MSEWYGSQEKPNNGFRKSLPQHLDRANPRRQLTKEETTKLSKLETIA
ncbi:hypothetical protein HVA01_03540 [Halovibrio variabilis]|uniref:Uncharacterized protein n=1 Tax=Halovibrio variabilis TaxID=31910 RepID=A0A511UM26_9GAMM|nr:hypothetical protein HVA01_03540 [Halovibrio variabilis]